MNKILKLLFVGCFLIGNVYAAQGNFTIESIGGSNNTSTVFIETLEEADTECSDNKLFRLPDTDKSADRFYSLALAAQAQGKKITIDYSYSGCLQGAVLIDVFKLRK